MSIFSRRGALLASFALLFFTACSGPTQPATTSPTNASVTAASKRLNIVATTTLIADMAQNVAGTAAAIFGVVPGVVGAVIGAVIDRQFDGTITPLAIGFVVGNSIAWLGWRWAIAASRNP